MTTMRRRLLILLAVCWCGVAVWAQASNDGADVKRLIESLDLHDDSVVADIGAGTGVLSVLMAPHVGKVYATDIEPKRLAEMRQAAERGDLSNMSVVEGAPASTNLPEQSCDAIFMRDVYHHFDDPPAMNASLLRTLKPGGRIAVIDFAPRSKRRVPAGKRAEGRDHGVLAAEVIEELEAAGFADIKQVQWSSADNFAVVAMRPR